MAAEAAFISSGGEMTTTTFKWRDEDSSSSGYVYQSFIGDDDDSSSDVYQPLLVDDDNISQMMARLVDYSSSGAVAGTFPMISAPEMFGGARVSGGGLMKKKKEM